MYGRLNFISGSPAGMSVLAVVTRHGMFTILPSLFRLSHPFVDTLSE
jgi:hypothetical protein